MSTNELLVDALGLYAAENGLNVLAFPSIGLLSRPRAQYCQPARADDPRSGGQIDGFLTSVAPRACSRRQDRADVARHERGIAGPR